MLVFTFNRRFRYLKIRIQINALTIKGYDSSIGLEPVLRLMARVGLSARYINRSIEAHIGCNHKGRYKPGISLGTNLRTMYQYLLYNYKN